MRVNQESKLQKAKNMRGRIIRIRSPTHGLKLFDEGRLQASKHMINLVSKWCEMTTNGKSTSFLKFISHFVIDLQIISQLT